jgi:hypothetical protein
MLRLRGGEASRRLLRQPWSPLQLLQGLPAQASRRAYHRRRQDPAARTRMRSEASTGSASARSAHAGPARSRGRASRPGPQAPQLLRRLQAGRLPCPQARPGAGPPASPGRRTPPTARRAGPPPTRPHSPHPAAHAGTSRPGPYCGTCGGHRGPHTTHHDQAAHDRARRRYNGRHAKAASTGFPEEADACRAKPSSSGPSTVCR